MNHTATELRRLVARARHDMNVTNTQFEQLLDELIARVRAETKVYDYRTIKNVRVGG